jgi:hypothetical protein
MKAVLHGVMKQLRLLLKMDILIASDMPMKTVLHGVNIQFLLLLGVDI